MNKLKKIELIEEMSYLQNQLKTIVSRIGELEDKLRITEKPKRNDGNHNEDCPFKIGDVVQIKGTFVKAVVNKIYPSEGMVKVCTLRDMHHQTYGYDELFLRSR